MSIADAINNARQKINNVYNALAAKGATLPGTMNLDHMVTTVEAIPEFHQTASLMNGWNATINESGFVLTNTPFSTSDLNIVLPNVSSINGICFLGRNRFANFTNLQSIDLQNIPLSDGSLYCTFRNCVNLSSVTGIPENVTNMAYTFQMESGWASEQGAVFNQNIQIPNSVTNMCSTFQNCPNLNQNIQIPNSVVDMSRTFYNCPNLNQNIQIPNSVINMANTFSHCNRLNQPIQIPNSVVDMADTFYMCNSLNQPIQIPNSVINMTNTFSHCRSLNQNIQIGNSVTNMRQAFMSCDKFGQSIVILSPEVANLAGAFSGFGSKGSYIYIPFNYSNNVRTTTFNSFVSEGLLYANGVSNNTRVNVQDLASLNT